MREWFSSSVGKVAGEGVPNCGAAKLRRAAVATKTTANKTSAIPTARVLEESLTSTSHPLGNLALHLRFTLNHLPPIFHSFLELPGQLLHFIRLTQSGQR